MFIFSFCHIAPHSKLAMLALGDISQHTCIMARCVDKSYAGTRSFVPTALITSFCLHVNIRAKTRSFWLYRVAMPEIQPIFQKCLFDYGTWPLTTIGISIACIPSVFHFENFYIQAYCVKAADAPHAIFNEVNNEIIFALWLWISQMPILSLI